MRYFPQVWASDNTDAIARLPIQYGSSYLYPTISMGAHVSAVPNHQMG
ncbi:alpha-galactosidase domain protein, partial (plasmid) [Streptococcus oralis]